MEPKKRERFFILARIGSSYLKKRQNIYICVANDYIGYLNIHGTHVTANNSTNNNAVFFFVSGLKIVYYDNY